MSPPHTAAGHHAWLSVLISVSRAWGWDLCGLPGGVYPASCRWFLLPFMSVPSPHPTAAALWQELRHRRARDGTDMWKRPAVAQLLQLFRQHCLLDTAGYWGPWCSPKIHQEISNWLCLCSPGDPSFFPNTLPPQTGNRLPLDPEYFRSYQHSSSRNYNWNLFPPLCQHYTKTLKAQSFSIKKWSSGKLLM